MSTSRLKKKQKKQGKPQEKKQSIPTLQLGIDFGTTHTVVSYCDRGNFPYLYFEDTEGEEHWAYPTLIAYPHQATHSFLDQSDLRFGLDAYQVRNDPKWSVFRDLKRVFLGNDQDLPLPLSALYTSPTPPNQNTSSSHAYFFQILCDFVKTLKKDLCTRSTLTSFLTSSKANQIDVNHFQFEVALAFPAQAHSTQRFLTLEAFKQNGFKVKLALNEPTAVAIDHLHAHYAKARKKASSSELAFKTDTEVVVFDLGGGTLDLSWVRQTPKGVEILKSKGSNQIGGQAFDQALVDLFIPTQIFTSLSLQAQTRLLEQARLQKESLRPQSRRVIFDFDVDLDPKDQEILNLESLTASQSIDRYYELCTPLIEEMLGLLDDLLEGEPLPSQVQHLYVTGGGSTLPKVMRLLKAKYGRKVKKALTPFGSVATGLAVALFEPHLHHKESIARYFGVFREWDAGQHTAFDPIYQPQTDLVSFSSKDQTYTVTRRYRPVHNVGYFRFVECDWLKEGRPEGVVSVRGDVYFPYDSHLQSSVRSDKTPVDLSQIPIQPLKHNRPLIEERYTLDQCGLLHISMHNLENSFSMEYTLNPLT